MINIFSIFDMPSLSKFDNHFEAMFSEEYNIFDYIICGRSKDDDSFNFITRIQLLEKIIANGNKPFYGNELFGTHYKLGGWMNGLKYNGIIKETGKTKEMMLQIDDKLYRKCEIKEWKINIDTQILHKILNEFKKELKSQL